MREPECMDPDGTLVPFSACPVSVLKAVADGSVQWTPDVGVPDEERIARQIAAVYVREHGG